MLALLQGPIGETIFAGLGALIFAGYIVFDTGAAVWPSADRISTTACCMLQRCRKHTTDMANKWCLHVVFNCFVDHGPQYSCVSCMLCLGPPASAFAHLQPQPSNAKTLHLRTQARLVLGPTSVLPQPPVLHHSQLYRCCHAHPHAPFGCRQPDSEV